MVLLQRGELERMATVLGHVSPARVALAALPQLATYAAAAAVWYLVLWRAERRRHLSGLYLLGVAKLFMDQAVPSGGVSGSLLVVAALRRRGVSTRIATAALLVGLISFYLAFIIAAVTSLIVTARGHTLNREIVLLVIVFLGIALALLLAILWLRRRSARLEGWLARLPVGRPFWDAIRDAPATLLKDVPLLLATTLLQISIIALDAATLWILLDALGAPTAYPSAFASFALASIFADVIPVPLGLGSFELALVGLLRLGGTGLAAAAAGTLLLRGLSFWAPMLPGLWLARREIRGAAAVPDTD